MTVLGQGPTDVRFTPESGHSSERLECPLCARLRFKESPLAAQPTRTPLLVLFTDRLRVRFTIGIEKLLAALLPRRLEFGRCDVPVRPAFLGHGT
jgi:hypothetical protein